MPLDGDVHQYVQSSAGRRRLTRRRRRLSLDWETFGEQQLVGPKSVGVWNYSQDMATEVLMGAYRIDEGEYLHVDLTQESVPSELYDALCDEDFEKWSFNAAFERLIAMNTLFIPTPIKGWRCTMALASMQSFTGTLLEVGRAMQLDTSKLKSTEGDRLIKIFCGPQRITKANRYYRRSRRTDPEDWQRFCDYNVQDVVAEDEIREKLLRFHDAGDEWELYEIDQEINDRGMPVNKKFVENAEVMSDIRRGELHRKMIVVTGLDNPNSGKKLLPWIQQRGYPFGDLQKATVTKVLKADKGEKFLAPECRHALRLRQQASRTSVKKYPAILRRLSPDGNLRHAFQYGGAARTLRWSGRGPQPHNLVRTPKSLEAEDGDWSKLNIAAQIIESGNYSDLALYMEEPMTALAGSIRSSFQSPEGYVLTVADLKAIESAVAAWLSGCERMLNVFREGRDPYKDFGVEVYRKAYSEITSSERTIMKPACLGCIYQLGGGTLKNGKRTGLWGYAESMGVDITEEEAAAHVKLFRATYPEIPKFWYALDTAAKAAIRGKPTSVGKLRFAMLGPYLTVGLPSSRKMYYYKPQIKTVVFEAKEIDPATGKPKKFTRQVVSYMGKSQITHQWSRVYTSGGKQCENIVQATARDLLAIGMKRAWKMGFKLIGSVHDELMALTRRGDNYFTASLLSECMTAPISWATGLPLGASGYQATIYRKD